VVPYIPTLQNGPGTDKGKSALQKPDRGKGTLNASTKNKEKKKETKARSLTWKEGAYPVHQGQRKKNYRGKRVGHPS